MMKWALILVLALGAEMVYEKPAEAGLFRRGPMRRFLFGGPIRRRMIARRMARRMCRGCMARRPVPRCGPGIHGGRCGLNNRNFRNPQNFRNFQFFGDPLRSQFLPGDNLFLNPLFNPNAAVFDPFRTGFSPVSAQVKQPELERRFLQAQEPDITQVRQQNWSGFCEDLLGARTPFSLPKMESVRFQQGSLTGNHQNELLSIRSIDDEQLVVRREGPLGRSYCLVDKSR